MRRCAVGPLLVRAAWRPVPAHRGERRDRRPAPTTTAARAVLRPEGLRPRRHRGHALDDVSRRLRDGRFTAIMGPSGSGKSTLHALRRRPRHAHVGHGLHRRHRPRHAERQAPHRAAAGQGRLRLPGLQPRADADRAGEHHAAAATSPAASPTRSGSTRSSTRSASRDRLQPPAERAVGRAAAARRRRPRARPRPGDHLRRRADGEPRLAGRRARSSRFMRRAVRRARPDHRHGHPRPGGRQSYADASSSWPTAASSTSWHDPTAERCSTA